MKNVLLFFVSLFFTLMELANVAAFFIKHGMEIFITAGSVGLAVTGFAWVQYERRQLHVTKRGNKFEAAFGFDRQE